MGSFLATRRAARLTRVNQETRQKATDRTFGVFRHFAMTDDECGTYGKIQKLHQVKHLGMIQTAYVQFSSVVPSVAEWLEASRATLTRLHVASGHYDNCYTTGDDRGPGLPLVFPRLTFMRIEPIEGKWLHHMSARRWRFSALRTLQVSGDSCGSIGDDEHNAKKQEALVRVLEASPSIEELQCDRGSRPYICDEGTAFGDAQWADFIAALGRCPHIRTIDGLVISMDGQLGRLADLKNGLSQHWGKPETRGARKQLRFLVRRPSIGPEFGRQGVDIGQWAAEVNCEVTWAPAGVLGRELTIDCGSDAGRAHPAPVPGSMYGQMATQLAAKATTVRLKLGGTALHSSWRGKLILPKATDLTIEITEGASASDVMNSIPDWLIDTEGDDPAEGWASPFSSVDDVDLHFGTTLSVADLPAAPSKLSLLMGGLTDLELVTFISVSSLATACELLSYLSVRELTECRIAADDVSSEWTDVVPAAWGLRCPHIEEIRGYTLPSKNHALSFVEAVDTLRPAKVSFVLGWGGVMHDLRDFACECYEQLSEDYTITKVDSDWDENLPSLDVELEAK